MTKIINSWFVGSNSRKSSLTIYLHESFKEQPLLIFAHGFKGFKDWGHFPVICKSIAEQGIAVLAFNFTHNGGTVENPIDFPDLEAFSENNYSKEVEDVNYLLDWVEKNRQQYFEKVNTMNLSILGHSRGGGIALLASSRFKQIKKVITWAAVANFLERLPPQEELEEWRKLGVRTVFNGRTKQDMPMKYDMVKDLKENAQSLNIETAVRKMGKPLLIIHGSLDETVSFRNAERLKEWGRNATLLKIESGTHTFSGKHPWNEEELPLITQKAVKATIRHILG